MSSSLVNRTTRNRELYLGKKSHRDQKANQPSFRSSFQRLMRSSHQPLERKRPRKCVVYATSRTSQLSCVTLLAIKQVKDNESLRVRQFSGKRDIQLRQKFAELWGTAEYWHYQCVPGRQVEVWWTIWPHTFKLLSWKIMFTQSVSNLLAYVIVSLHLANDDIWT